MTDVQTATIPADEFLRVATNVALFASSDETYPTLCAVRFRPAWDGSGRLMAEATNEYVAAQEILPLTDLDHYWATKYDGPGHECPSATTELTALVGTKDLANLVKTLKMQLDGSTKFLVSAERPHVRITVTEGEPRAAFTLVQNAGNEVTVSPRLVDGDFPRSEQLYDRAVLGPDDYLAALAADEAEWAERTGNEPRPLADVHERDWMFNPAYLQLFTKVVPDCNARTAKTVMLEVHLTATCKPVLVRYGDTFRGLIVPVREAAR